MTIGYRWQLVAVALLFTVVSGGLLWVIGSRNLIIATWSSPANDSATNFLRLGFLFGVAHMPGKALPFTIWNGILQRNVSWSTTLWAFSVFLAIVSALSSMGSMCYISWLTIVKPMEGNLRLSNLYLLCTSAGVLLTCAIAIYCVHLHTALAQYNRIVDTRRRPIFRFGSAFFASLGFVAIITIACVILVLVKLERLSRGCCKTMTPARSTPQGRSTLLRFGCDTCSFN